MTCARVRTFPLYTTYGNGPRSQESVRKPQPQTTTMTTKINGRWQQRPNNVGLLAVSPHPLIQTRAGIKFITAPENGCVASLESARGQEILARYPLVDQPNRRAGR